MDKDRIIKRLELYRENTEYDLTIGQVTETIKYINSLESERDKYKADAVEMAKFITGEFFQFYFRGGNVTKITCFECDTEIGKGHTDVCSIGARYLKAEQLLSDNKHTDRKEII